MKRAFDRARTSRLGAQALAVGLIVATAGCDALRALGLQAQGLVGQVQAAKVDLSLPFIGVDQDNPVAYQFVSHQASAKVTVNDALVEQVEEYEWSLRDSAGKDVPLNASGDRMEWLPTKAGRYTVAVRMSYRDKGITQARDVTVGDASSSITGLSRGDIVTLTWPKGPTKVPHSWDVAYSLNGGAERPLTLTDPNSGTQGHQVGNYDKLKYMLKLRASDGKEFFSESVDAMPAIAQFELWAEGKMLSPQACNERNWSYDYIRDPDVIDGRRSPDNLEIRNTGRVRFSFVFRHFTTGTKYRPGEDGPPENPQPLSGTLSPGATLDITSYRIGDPFGLLGSTRPFSEKSASDEGIVPWDVEEVGRQAASTLYLAQVSIGSGCSTPGRVW